MKRRLVLALAVAMVSLALVNPVFAIFGLGDIVFDPTNLEEAVQQLLEMEQQYEQLVQTYQMIQNQYDHMKWMAKRVPVDMATRYRSPITLWQGSTATNTYGTTDAWVSGINTGADVPLAYARAVQQLGA